MVRRAFAYGTGTPSDENDRRVLEFLSERFADDGYVLPDLLREIALSHAFSKVHLRRQRAVHPLPDLKSAQRPSQLTAASEPAPTAPQL